ncbi:hypothetical protein C5167_047692 [Papaver somniferum]|uniref:Uncharacterized protein n=1 Tax=Papaver somniferum TaxID=3469 RepID=A0A4Y7LI44_PAPSO|nr:ribonuclease S-2-like [Papaver somniferum]RZC84906.1 hypothetical protein C5167_047692 [Papaver somniferum]
MKQYFSFLLLLLLFSTFISSILSLSIHNIQQNEPATTTQTTVSFNNYSLVIQFPKSLCDNPKYGRKCDGLWKLELPNKFTVHGLWPNFGSNREPAGPGVKLDVHQLITKDKILANNLYNSWPDVYFDSKGKGGTVKQNLKQQAAWEFWGREWKKHGDLSGLSPEDYFRTTYSLYDDLENIYEDFKTNGLINMQGRINVNLASQRLEIILHGKPFIKCVTNKLNMELLAEIHIAYRRSDLMRLPHSDSKSRNHNCSSDIAYLRV